MNSVQTVAICDYIEPMSAVIFAMIFHSEAAGPVKLAGAAVIPIGPMIREEIRRPVKT